MPSRWKIIPYVRNGREGFGEVLVDPKPRKPRAGSIAKRPSKRKAVKTPSLRPYSCGYCGCTDLPVMGLWEGQDWPRCPSCQGL